MKPSLDAVSTALNAQWDRTNEWLHSLGPDLMGQANQESSAAGWTVHELIVHTGTAMDTLINAQPAEPGEPAITLPQYVRAYADRANMISEQTHVAALAILGTPAQFTTVQAQHVATKLVELGTDPDRLIQSRWAVMELRDLVASRLIEVVVHTLDLELTFADKVDMSGGRSPMDPGALRVVGLELLGILAARGATGLEVADPRQWILLATGRAPHTSVDVAAALKPTYTAGGIEDLGTLLPLL